MTSNQNQKNKEKLYIRLLSAHYVRIKSFIFTLLPNESDADDVMQETSITLWDKFDGFEPGTDFVAWAVTIAKFKVLEFRRANMHKMLILDDRVLELLEQENQTLFDKSDEKTQALLHCVQKLSSHDQAFLKLRYSQNLTLQKLAKRLGSSVTSTYRHSARVHGLLLECMRRILKFGVAQ